MKPSAVFKLLFFAAFLLLSKVANSQAPTLYTTLPAPIEVTSFPYVEEGFDSDATATGAPTGMLGACPALPCCSGVWYKVTVPSNGSLFAALDELEPLATGLMLYKADSENITETSELSYVQISQNFCGFRNIMGSDMGYNWPEKYYSAAAKSDPDYSEQWNSYLYGQGSLEFPADLNSYPSNGWRSDLDLEAGTHYIEAGTYWLYAWNKNQQANIGGTKTPTLVIDFVELCPEGFNCFAEEVTICSAESFTTPGGQVISETASYEETIGSDITTYNVTLDEDLFCCPEGVDCTTQAVTICTAEVFTTPNGTEYSEGGRFVEEIDATTRNLWTITEDASVNCCPNGFTCNIIDVTECANLVYTSPLGNTTTVDGSVIDVDEANSIRNTYNVTFQRANATADFFMDAVIAESGSVTYEANTPAAGVLQFDKSQDYWVNLNTLADDLAGKSRSVFMWVKSEANVANDNQALFAINQSNGNNRSILFIDNTGDNLEVNRGGSNNQSGSFNMSDQLWHYVGYTYDFGTNETVIYVDGLEQSRGTRDQDAIDTDQYSLGQEFDGSNDTDHFNSVLTEVSVWDEVLTGPDIRQAMKAKINNGHPKYANLVGYYSVFGDCDDDVAVLTDHSGKGNHGAVQNGLTIDFKNVQPVDGFNAIDWYENLSWKKDGTEVATTNTFTTDVVAGSYEFSAARSFILSTDTWTMTANSNATTVDDIADETLCENNPITRTVPVNTVSYLDFERSDENYVGVDAIVDDLVGSDRSIFMWVNKEANVPSGTSYQILTIHGDDGLDDIARFYINSSERLGITSNGTDYSTNTITTGTWAHVGYTYEAATMTTKVYIDGEVVRTITGVDMGVTTGAVATLGMRFDDDGPSRFFDGKMVDVTVWDKLLTDAEIGAIKAAAPANDATNLVAHYGTAQSIADNILRDQTTNGNDGLTSHSTIIVSDLEETITDYDASANYRFSWKKMGTEFDTDVTGNINIEEGTTAYTVTYGTPLFQKTDDFSLSYTNLLTTQPVAQSAATNGSATFMVDEISGANYQWYKKQEGFSFFNSNIEGFPNTPAISSIFVDNGKWYAETTSGLGISTDQGISWQTITRDDGLGSNTLWAISADGDNIYAASSTGISISKDAGQTWVHTTFQSELGVRNSLSIKDVFVVDGNIYLASTSNDHGIIISADNGLTWTSDSFGDFNRPLTLFVDNDIIYAGTEKGEFRYSTNNGSSWTTLDGADYGLPDARQVEDIFVSGPKIYLATSYGLAISNDSGDNWTTVEPNQNGFLNSGANTVFVNGDDVYATSSSNGGGLAISNDGGQSWRVMAPGEQGLVYDDQVYDVKEVDGELFVATDLGFNVLRDRIALSDNAISGAANQIQGATTHQLTINNLSLDQNDTEYFVVVSKDGCNQQSDDATLSVRNQVLTSLTPAVNSLDIALDANIELVFDRAVTAGALTNEAIQVSGSLTGLYPLTLTGDGTTTLIFDPNRDFLPGELITVSFLDGANLGKRSFTFFTTATKLQRPAFTKNTIYDAVNSPHAGFVADLDGDGDLDAMSVMSVTEGDVRVYTHDGADMPGFANAQVTSEGKWGRDIVAGDIDGDGDMDIVPILELQNELHWYENDGAASPAYTKQEVISTGAFGAFSAALADMDVDGDLDIVLGSSRADKVIWYENDGAADPSFTEHVVSTTADNLQAVAVGDINGDGFPDIASASSTGDEISWYASDGAVDPTFTESVVTDTADGAIDVALGDVDGDGDMDILAISSSSREVVWYENDGADVPSFNAQQLNSSRNRNSNYAVQVADLDGDGDLDILSASSNLYWYENDGKTEPTFKERLIDKALTSVRSISVADMDGDGLLDIVIPDLFGDDMSWYQSAESNIAPIVANAIEDRNEDVGFESAEIDLRKVFEDENDDELILTATSSDESILTVSLNEATERLTITEVGKGTATITVTADDCNEETVADQFDVTISPIPLLLESLYPFNNQSGVSTTTSLSIGFDGAFSKGTGDIEIRAASDDQILTVIPVNSGLVTISGQEAIFTLGDTNLEQGAEYYVIIPETAFVTDAGANFTGFSDATSWAFTASCPELITEQPAGQTAFAGADATFSVPEVAGATYQWYSRSTEYRTIKEGDNGLDNFYAINSITVDGDNIYLGISSGLAISRDGGQSWTTVDNSVSGFTDSPYARDVAVVGDQIYVGFSRGGMSISKDGGATWATFYANRSNNGFSDGFSVNAIYAEDQMVYAGTDKGISISSDAGQTWTTTTAGQNGFAAIDDVRSVHVDNGVIYAGTYGGGVSKSEDNGQTWTTFTTTDVFRNNFVLSVFAEGSNIYVGLNGGNMYISNDDGQNWTYVPQVQGDLSITGPVKSIYANGDNVYAAPVNGMAFSCDGGVNWTFQNTGENGFLDDPSFVRDAGIPNVISALTVADGRIYAVNALGLTIANEPNQLTDGGDLMIAGATSRELTLSDVSMDRSGAEFFVKVTKDNCEEYSAIACLTVEEPTSPQISSLLPEDDATLLNPEDLNASLPSSSSFTITFDRPIAFDDTNASFELYTAADDQLVASQTLASTLSGANSGDITALSFGFASYQFKNSTEYYILMDAGMVKSKESGDAFAGITDKTTWSFSTAGAPFEWTTLAPSTGFQESGVDVPLKLTDFNLGFFQGHLASVFEAQGQFTAGEAGKIGLYTTADDQLVYEIDLANDPMVVAPENEEDFGKVSLLDFEGMPVLLIRDDFVMDSNTQYYWLMDEGIVQSSDGGRSKAIADKTSWAFTTESVTTEPLELLSFFPNADEPLDLSFDGITLDFADETEVAAGTGTLTIFRGSDDSVFETLNISDFTVRNFSRPNTVSADVSGTYELGETYYVQYPEGFVKSLDGTKVIAGVTDKTTWSYGTGPLGDAIFNEFSPAPGSSNYDVSKGNDFEIFFTEDVSDDDLEPIGAIRIYNASDNSLVKTIAYDGENDNDLEYPEEGDEIALEFNRNELEPDTEYYILIDDGFVVSYEGPAYRAGISDPNTWRFTTAALPTEPSIVSTFPAANATEVAVGTDIQITFSENVRPGTGNMVLYDADGNVVETIPVGDASISGTTASFSLSSALEFNQGYYVLIDDGAFESLNGVSFAGVSQPGDISFSTESPANSAPVATSPDYSGNLEVNQQLEGSYDYNDDNGNEELGSAYQWYIADDATGANPMPIDGATAQNYDLTAAEEGKFIALAIIPNDGLAAGDEVFTTYRGPVVPPVVPTVIGTEPTDGAEDVETDASLIFEFSEEAVKGTGTIRITPANGTAIELDIDDPEVTIDGNSVNITLSPSLLSAGAFYTVTFDAEAFVDADGNNSAGLTSGTAWNFTTKEDNVAPEAQAVGIKESLVVTEMLEGSYTFFDQNGDDESGTQYQWYRSDDASGTNRAPIANAFLDSYTAISDDNGKFISFEVTPSDGVLTGTATESNAFGPILIDDGVTNIPPAFTSDALTSVLDDEAYSYTITFVDNNNDVPVLTKTTGPDWLSVNGFELTGNPGSENIGVHDLVLTLDDQNGGTVTQEFTITVALSNVAPSVMGIDLSGITTIDEVLTGSYNFLDDDGNADQSTYKWYRADDDQGSNKVAIDGATAASYTLSADDAGKFISFEVSPNDGTVDGTVVESEFVGAVAKKIPTLSLTNISKSYGDDDFELAASTNSTGSITYTFDNDQTGANLNGATVTLGGLGDITVDVSLAEDAEFQARMVNGTISVEKRTIEFTATDASKIIGADDPQLAFTVTQGSVVGTDQVVTLSRDAGEAAGTYAMTFTEAANAANYDISTVDGTFTIGQIALTLTADAASKTYGEADPEFTYSITSGALETGDELNGALTRAEGDDAGTYAIESGLFNVKYDITFVPANLTITQADLSISVDDQARNFGEANPEFTLSFNGLTNGDTGADLDTPPVASTTATETSAAGTYDITLNTPADANYNITGTTNGTLTVNGVDIALTIADITANEDDGDITVTVALDNAVGGGFTVEASTTDATATAGADYTAVTGQTLTFAGTAGEQQTFTITPTADFTEEPDESLTVSLGNLAGTALPVDITDNATVTISNDDVDSDLFIITFETTADNETVNLPTSGIGYDFGVDWGDGSIDFGLSDDKAHTYATAGTYTVRITGDFPRIYFKGAEDAESDANALKIKSVEQWGTNQWASMNGAFEGAMNMVVNATDVPDLSAVFSMEEMFSDCDALTDEDFSTWDVSNVSNMKEMFERANNFNGNISTWDVSNVTTMEQMFKDALAFNGDITGWNTSSVQDMSRMFQRSDQSPEGTNMAFNQNIDGWNVSSVTDFSRIFEDNNVFNQDLNSWDVSSAEDMASMFSGADTFNGNIIDWDVSSVTEMQNMFANAAVFNQDISGWEVGAVEDMEEMFDGATVFNANIRNWDVSSVTNFKQMFEDTDAFNANISIWNTASMTDMDGMFLRAKAFNQDISEWDISGLTTLQQVFENADAFNQDLSGWNTGSITDMSSLFEEADLFNQDISNWNVSMVTDMGDLFLNAAAFDQSLANWDMSSADDLEDMLSGTGLSVANYDATLTGWAAQTVQSGLTLGVTGLEYCASLTDRQSLISDDGWTISGDTQACETVVTITDIGAVEDDGDITVTVTSSNVIIGGFTVDISTADATATAGTDYTAITAQTLTFTGDAGEEQTFTFSPTADSDDEPNETVTVNMSNLVVAAGNTVDITDQGTVTIFNEDVASAFFTTIWETTSDNESIIIPTEGEGYNYRVDWGDGTIEKNQTGEASHSYATAGEYTVKIVGSFPRIYLSDNGSNAEKLQSVEQWGTIEWTSMEGAFAGTEDLVINTGSNPDLSQVESMRSMFYNAKGFNSDISAWDVSNVTSFQSTFNSTDAFNQDISGWNVSAATTMREMFSETESFNQDISAWDVSNVENMFSMFQNADVFNQPLDGWNVSKVTNMSRMFNGADIFNQDLNSWNTGSVENFKEMFRNAFAFDGNIGAWDVSAGTDFEAMFEDAHAFNQDIGAWNLANAIDLNAMFRDARLFNQDISAWRFPGADEIERMFYEAAAFNQDISSWEMGKITDISSIFESATSFNQDLSAWDVSNVDDFSWAFGRASAFNQDISAWDVSKGENFSSMFREVAAFDQDLSTWVVTSATNMSSMFNNGGLSVANYDAILTAWARQEVQRDVELGVEGLQYCAGSNGRQTLIDIKGWTIQNDGISCITTVTIEDIMAAENDGDITVTLVSDSFVAEGFTVDVTTADGTATAGEDYTAVVSETITFFGVAGEEQFFTISPLADETVEPDETLTLTMSNVVTGANNTITATDQATITILNDDNDAPVATDVAIAGLTQVGQTLTGSYTYSDSESDPESGTTFQWYTGTAAGTALMPISGATSTTLTLTSDLVEENLFFGVIPANGINTGEESISAVAGPVQALPVASFAATSASASESTSAASIEVSLDQAGLVTSNVDYTITGTATGTGTDYTLAAGTLTFAAGDDSETLSLAIIDDAIVEANETVIVTLSNPLEASLGTNTTFTYTIEDDDQATVTLAPVTSGEADGPIILTATLDKEVDGGFTVDLRTDESSAENGVDYTGLQNVSLTFAGTAGETQVTVITPIDDETFEFDEEISVGFTNLANTSLDVSIGANVSVTIEDNDQAQITIADVSANEDDGDISVTLLLSKAVTGGFTVDVNTTDLTATAGVDYTALTAETVTFAGTVGETQTVLISPIADSNVEGNETFRVSMNNLLGTALSVDIADEAIVTIVGDDQPIVTFTAASASNAESTTTSDIEVTLNQVGLSTVTVDYAVSGTATGRGTDYTLASGTISFVAGDVSETISLGVINDDIVEADETVIVTLSNTSGASLGTNSTFTYTIENDDEAVVNLEAVTSGEGDGDITLTAILDKAVAGGFTVDLITAESSAIKGVDYTGLENVTLTFTGTAGETQSTTITLIDDDIIEFEESISVLFDNLTNTNLNVQAGDVVEVTIEDNDQAAVILANVSQFEDGESFRVTATLDKAVTGGFTVDVSTTDGTATTADGDYTAVTSQTLTFAGTAGETQIFDISPGFDIKLEADEAFTVAMSNLSGTTLPVVIADDATLTITNDDAAAVTIADVSGNEGDGAITVTATLDNAVQGGFTVDVSTADGTATIANSDYTAIASQTLTFAGTAGETQTFTVSPTNDQVIEGDETLTVSLSGLSTSLAVDVSDVAMVTLVNDDFNNAPTDITLSATSIAENEALDATVGSLATADADAGNTHTYSLVAGTGADDNSDFLIDGADLKVNNTSFNFEDRSSYSIRVQTDDGEGGTFAKVLTIAVTNVNENPFQVGITNATIAESDEAQEVGVLMTLDPDNGETFTYEFTNGEQDAHNDQFEIVGSTVRTKGAINFEDGASRDFRIRVTDAGGLTLEWPFSITIEDVLVEPVRDYTTNTPGADVKNVFSPNGDGVNETWVIEDLLDNPINEVKVFAQGGKLIYSKVNYRNDWAGTFRDDPVPDGTYYYEITIFENAQSTTPARVIKGFLTIIRTR